MPHSGTGIPPSALIFNRTLRTKFSVNYRKDIPEVNTDVANSIEKRKLTYQKINEKRAAKNKEIGIGSKVRIKEANGNMSEEMKVVEVWPIRIRTSDQKVWPLRIVCAPRDLYGEKKEERMLWTNN